MEVQKSYVLGKQNIIVQFAMPGMMVAKITGKCQVRT